ncbi:MAG: hypothetical protein PF549_03310 [Patescibacteria group bacterium]|jgi:hypothetical protein|nr:hypothetical protein [Patescibacteria group bacterium]
MENLKMDSSNRSSYVLGKEIRLDIFRITPEEWFNLIMKVISRVKPQLQYLSSFQPIWTILRDMRFHMRGANAIFDGISTFKGNVSDQTKCGSYLLVLNNDSSDKELDVPRNYKDMKPSAFKTRDEIRLSVKGDFVYWKASYETIILDEFKDLEKIYYEHVRFLATKSEFRVLSDKEVVQLIRDSSNEFAKDFFRGLWSSFEYGNKRTEERLTKSREKEAFLKGILERTGFCF